MAAIINNTLGKLPCLRPTFSVVFQNFGKHVAHFSTNNESDTLSPKEEAEITKSVFISQSNDIFTNLAIEDWIYKNFNFSKHHILLVWRNNPCVVIGRHQNPWLEANIDYLTSKKIDIARRNSGGGTVYHDKGNINLTFFTPKEQYNRKANLGVIQRAIFREFFVNVDITSRDDLLLNNYHKVSGTASRIGRNSAYHHCTLLIDANKKNLSNSLLKNNEDEITTKATRSVPSPIKNLRDGGPSISPERFLKAIGWEYLRTSPLTYQDGGLQLTSKQRGFQLINPTDKWFPGLAKIRDGLCSWEWRFGRTPEFTISRSSSLLQDASLSLKVKDGIINDLVFRVAASEGALAKSDALSEVRGQQYNSSTLGFLERSLAEPEVEAQALRA